MTSCYTPSSLQAKPIPMTDPVFKSDFLKTLQARGYIHQITHPVELDEAAATGIVTGYIGFDATAPSLHVGSLIQIMMLRRLQQAGHRPIVIMGGGTTKVGDPTGKDTSRPQLTEADIAANIASPGGPSDIIGMAQPPDLAGAASGLGGNIVLFGELHIAEVTVANLTYVFHRLAATNITKACLAGVAWL